jgi:tRNA 5-methylaminomethyl-2-thiouridine biosynthesis bifunctional protein
LPELAIIGAGIAGCALAHRMVRAGWSVTLFDPQPGSGGSGNPWALLHEPPGDSLDVRLLRTALRLTLEQLAELPISQDALLRDRGQIVAVAPRELLSALLTTVVPDRLRQVNQLVRGLRAQPGSGWLLQCADASEWRFSHVVLANALAAALVWPPITGLLQAVRGQIDEFRIDPSALAMSRTETVHVLRGDAGYALSARPAKWLVGASFQPGRSELECQPADTLANRARLSRLLDVPLDGASAIHLGGRAAVRAVTADRRPMIGAAPAASGGWARDGWPLPEPGLWLNTGHGAHGFTWAFLAAEILAAELQSQCAALPARERQALAPGRFARR